MRLVRLECGGKPPEVGIHDGVLAENAARKILSHKNVHRD
jgi:hypothetical protein